MYLLFIDVFTIHLYVFTIPYYSFIHIYLLFVYVYFTYLDENPYLVEFDETPKFWYPRVVRDAWINLTFCDDQF